MTSLNRSMSSSHLTWKQNKIIILLPCSFSWSPLPLDESLETPTLLILSILWTRMVVEVQIPALRTGINLGGVEGVSDTLAMAFWLSRPWFCTEIWAMEVNNQLHQKSLPRSGRLNLEDFGGHHPTKPIAIVGISQWGPRNRTEES